MKLTDLLKFKKWIFDEYPNINIEQLTDYDIVDYHQKKQLALCNVVSSLPSKDEKLIGNMCLSFRHDFGLLPKMIQDELKRDCKNWLIAYENNRS